MRNIESSFGINPVKTIEASPIEKYEERCRFNRISLLRVETSSLLQEIHLAVFCTQGDILVLNASKFRYQSFDILLDNAIGTDEFLIDVVDDSSLNIGVLLKNPKHNGATTNKGLNIRYMLTGCKIAGKRFANLIQQLCLPSNPFDEWSSLCVFLKNPHTNFIFLQSYKKYGSEKNARVLLGGQNLIGTLQGDIDVRTDVLLAEKVIEACFLECGVNLGIDT